ncbi:MAG: hypothetical protein IPO85_19835 [Saprospiraceae bacterium]|uniref:Uncharacterized protein n=1 Tax=Candidatus Defluviibacterium haderslevense TaxID=2981993 RepID=A0A9D7SDP6_9BACT|nr:hypothetical protein [Candidatus Defluviibacterium haderslevense]
MKQVLILFIVFFIHPNLWSQCIPPYTLNITDAPVLCSLSQLNGMTCSLVPSQILENALYVKINLQKY